MMESKQEKVIDVTGEPVQGPKERQGKDEVQAKLSFHDLGVTHAKALSRSDELHFIGQSTVRDALIQIIKAPQESWASYTDGFKDVLDERKKAEKPTMALSVMKAQVSRVLNAAKRNPTDVSTKLADSKLRWNIMLKNLPKVHPGKGAPTHETTAEQTAIEAETNVGTLVQMIQAAAKRLEYIGQAHKPQPAYYAWYMGKNMREFFEIAQADCLKIIGDNTVAGIINQDVMLKALDLEFPVTPATPATEAVEQQVAA